MNETKMSLTAEQIYHSNKKKAKIFTILTPIIWYVFLVIAIIAFMGMMRNSLGNILEISEMLDKDLWTRVELQRNYQTLVDKWGEWEIVAAGGGGIAIKYVNITNALFSGAATAFATVSFVSLVIAIVFGKIVFPLLRKHYKNLNDELVDIATLQSAAQIEKIAKKDKSKKEWF